ncbi:MAG: sigma-54 dependent transcriptional regulator [Planctomycetota bacterium]
MSQSAVETGPRRIGGGKEEGCGAMIATGGKTILIADDEVRLLDLCIGELRGAGYEVRTCNSGSEALAILEQEPIDLLVADVQMPELGGLELTEKVHSEWPNLPVIILTGHASVENAVDSMRIGATDYICKPVDPPELMVRIEKGLSVGALLSDNARLSTQVGEAGRYGEIIGVNPKMQEVFQVIQRVADTPSRVLIQGEPGTGKELIARAIHAQSLATMAERVPAKRQLAVECPYVAVNCGAFSRNLLESQLFGHKKGTFTGAVADQEGVFVAARQGTLFLDEITELDLDLQVKLLRAIQEQEVTPLGSTRPVPIRARVITATNRPIAELVAAGAFRADLYYRINVVNLQVPPLRERVDDIPLLVDYFLKRTAESYHVAPRTITPKVLEAFQSYGWPGNVRELQNVIERAFALGSDERLIHLADLPQDLLRGISQSGEGGDHHVFPTYDQVVRSHLVRALQASRGVKTRAAGLLKIDRNRLYRLMKKYQIARE